MDAAALATTLREAEPIGRERVARDTLPLEGRRWQRPDAFDRRPSHKKPPLLGLAPLKESPLGKLEAPESSVPDVPGFAATAAGRRYREVLAANAAGRYERGEAARPSFVRRNTLPSDTKERERRFQQYLRDDPNLIASIPTAVPAYHRRENFELMPMPGAFPWKVADAPEPMLYEDVPLLNPGLFDGTKKSFYGNYVGPANPYRPGEEPPPLTPVDQAAWHHDHEYVEIYERYGYSEFEYGLSFTRELGLPANEFTVGVFGWLGQANSLDPAMQLELGWADMKIIGRSWGNIIGGAWSGFYGGGRGQEALATDLAWASAITVFHAALISWRLGVMVPAGLAFQVARGLAGLVSGLGNMIGGDVGKAIAWVGNFMDRIVLGVGNVFSVVNTFASIAHLAGGALLGAVVGGTVYVGAKIVQGVVNVIKNVGKAIGCFITTAVTQALGEPDDGPTLTLLRQFRDEYMTSFPEGRRAILKYYAVAPRIVDVIDARNDRDDLLRCAHSRWIVPATNAIREGKKRIAFQLYEEMMLSLTAMTGLNANGVEPMFHWKDDPRLTL